MTGRPTKMMAARPISANEPLRTIVRVLSSSLDSSLSSLLLLLSSPLLPPLPLSPPLSSLSSESGFRIGFFLPRLWAFFASAGVVFHEVGVRRLAARLSFAARNPSSTLAITAARIACSPSVVGGGPNAHNSSSSSPSLSPPGMLRERARPRAWRADAPRRSSELAKRKALMHACGGAHTADTGLLIYARL